MSDEQPDLSSFLEQAAALQEQLTQARDSAASQVVEGQAASGAVRVSVTGAMEFQSIHISPELVDDVSMLEDVLLAALHDAVAKVHELNQAAVGNLFD